jgi:hypothetical protein
MPNLTRVMTTFCDFAQSNTELIPIQVGSTQHTHTHNIVIHTTTPRHPNNTMKLALFLSFLAVASAQNLRKLQDNAPFELHIGSCLPATKAWDRLPDSTRLNYNGVSEFNLECGTGGSCMDGEEGCCRFSNGLNIECDSDRDFPHAIVRIFHLQSNQKKRSVTLCTVCIYVYVCMFAAYSQNLFVSLLSFQCVCNEYTSDPNRGDTPPPAPPVDVGEVVSPPTAAPTPIVDNCQRYNSTSDDYYEMENPFGMVPFYQTCLVDNDCPEMNPDGTKCCMAAFCFCKTTALAAQGINGTCVGSA